MVLESTVICVDNSDYMRNGDFVPSRLQAQQEAVNLLCNAKTRSNPENNVALVTLASSSEVLATFTTDVGRIMAKLQQVKPNGEINFVTGLRIAHLALRHRQGRNHRMRIVVFVGSPLKEAPKELTQLAKKLKKEKVSVDVINFGEEQEANDEILQAFIEEIGGKEGAGSHLATLVGGCDLVESLARSPIVRGDDGSGAAAAAAVTGASGFEFGVDPNEDPELALALRVSMEEQRQRQEREVRAATAQSQVSAENRQQSSTEEENMLVQALSGGLTDGSSAEAYPDFGRMSEEDQIAYAIQMSMQQAEEESRAKAAQEEAENKGKPKQAEKGKKASGKRKGAGSDDVEIMEVDEETDEGEAAAVRDEDFLQSVLQTLPGVDPHVEASEDGNQGGKGKEEEEKR